MGADKSAENTPNSQSLSAQIICPSPKVWDFDEKKLHWTSEVRVNKYLVFMLACITQNPDYIEDDIDLLERIGIG